MQVGDTTVGRALRDVDAKLGNIGAAQIGAQLLELPDDGEESTAHGRSPIRGDRLSITQYTPSTRGRRGELSVASWGVPRCATFDAHPG